MSFCPVVVSSSPRVLDYGFWGSAGWGETLGGETSLALACKRMGGTWGVWFPHREAALSYLILGSSVVRCPPCYALSGSSRPAGRMLVSLF